MPLNIAHTRERLQQFDFARLFIEELGWSNPPSRETVTAQLPAKNPQLSYTRKPIAQLSGVAVLEVTTPGGIPDAKARAAIAKDVAEHHLENLLIFLDAPRSQSLWYWVKREAGKAHARDHLYVKGQPGDLFLGKLATMVVDISELDAEGNIPITEVANRLKAALDVERVTKKFYKEFDAQRLEFIEHIHGITDDHQRRWYASVLMNRLMFIYFLQKKLFLDGGSENYLEDKLTASGRRGADKFYSVFLKALFFEGFARPEPARSAEARALLGKIRYLNGGLFLPHRVELSHGFPDRPRIKIPDVAFANILALFRRYSWNLNDTPGGKDDEINPDVLGYIFEKYINQKEFGAYYTRPEMTGYLCERTIFKLVLDRVNTALQRGKGEKEKGGETASRTVSSAPFPPFPSAPFHSISDLLLNLDATLCRALLFDVLPSLRLLDPACGSAAFLVAAMKVLIAIYSAVIGKIQFLNDTELARSHAQTRTEHPSVLYFIKKRIITDNLFGVDIMEEATEIARLRLFLALVASAQTEDQLEPLPNIDFNILAGNSLIGLLHVDAAKFDSPSPAGAGEGGRRPGEGRGASGQQRMTLQHTSDLGFAVETKTAPTRRETEGAYLSGVHAAQLAAILDHKNKSIELYRKHAFLPERGSPEPQRVGGGAASGISAAQRAIGAAAAGDSRAPADFADLVDQHERVFRLREDIENVRRDAYTRLNQMLLDEFNALGIQFEQATWDDRKNDTGKPDKRALKLADIEAQQPFHWGYEFDKVLAAGGFDGIITNPPWEIFKPQAKEFFDDHSDLVTKNKMTIKEFEKEQARLLKNPELREAWLEFLSRYPHVSLYFRNAAQFKNQIAIVNGKKAGTDINLYKLFLEQCFNLLRRDGECGIVIPSGIYTDLGAKQLRELLFNETEITGLFGFENRKEIFENVDSRFKFVVLTFRKGGSTEHFPAAFMRHSVEDLAGFPGENAVRMDVPLIRRLSPDSLSLMEFKQPLDAIIAEKALRFPLLGERLSDRWNASFSAEFHMTNDSDIFKTAPGKGRLPLYEGKMMHQFNHRFLEPRYWVEERAGRARVLGRLEDNGRKLDYQLCRLGFRDIARNTDERTLICTVIPPAFHGNKLPTLSVVEDGKRLISDAEQLFLCATWNSFVLDWLIRQRVTTTLNFFYLYQLPVPRLTAADAAFGPIVKRAAQLICTTPEFDALGAEVAQIFNLLYRRLAVGSASEPRPRPVHRAPGGLQIRDTAECNSALHGVTDPAARAQLRAELDGLIAHLYGLTEAEFAHILTTFPLVPAAVKDAALKAHRAAANGLIR